MKRLVPPSLVLVALSACSGGAGGEATVKMTEEQRFSPSSLTVEAGTTVTFVNDSSQAHTVTAAEMPSDAEYFSSGDFGSEEEARANLAGALVGQEGSYEVTLDVPGTYDYFCIPHEAQGMKGRIVVEAG